MNHEPIHENCKGCHYVGWCNIRDDGLVQMEEACILYPFPSWIWEVRGYCPEKTRHENFLPEWFKEK